MSVLSSVREYDFYHLPSYHALAERNGEGVAELFVHRDGQHLVAIPLLLRPIWEIPGFERVGSGMADATSVYGYVGPLASDWNLPNDVIRNFQTGLRESLDQRKVVSVFSRLHPMLDQQPLLSGLGETKLEGSTVSIDLTQSPETQLGQYRLSHRKGIRKLRDMGVLCFCDTEYQYFDDLIRNYYETMDRAHASSYYYFPEDYFRSLREALKTEMRLFVCRFHDETICAATFVLCNGILQGHLGGTRNDYVHLSPMKLLLDTVREWGYAAGARIFHLGGGVGSREDSLFRFKEGFSRKRHEFTTWRYVAWPLVYEKLEAEAIARKTSVEGGDPTDDFFPKYRAMYNTLR